MQVAISGVFSGRGVGSGRYTDRLLAALRETAEPGEHYRLIGAGSRRGAWSKLRFEQRSFPKASREFDLAHVPYWAPPLHPRVPTVVTIHDLIPLLLPEYRRRLDVKAYLRLVTIASRKAAAVLADSEHSARDIRRHLPVQAARVHVVPLGVDAEFRPPSSAGLELMRSRLKLPERYGLYLGGFDQRKNLEGLMQVWREVFARTGLGLAVAGRLPEQGDALHPHPAALARKAGLPESALHLLGFVPAADLPALYGGAAVFAFPSRYEGFGLDPLEAMACGTPVVVSKASSLPEVVGDAGRLIAPDERSAWADAIVEILEDSVVAAELRDRGLARAARFDWKRSARLTRATYRSLLE